jgi:hypothetical protein
MPLERSTWPLLCGCDTEAQLILMPKSAQVFELPCSKLSPIISDNVVGHAKPVHDHFDEFHHLSRCDVGGKLYFDPLHELIHCDKDMCESTFSFLEQTNQI